MADIFEIVGRISLDGIDEAERNLNNMSGAGEQSASKLSKLGGIAKTVGKGLLVATGAVVTGAVGLVKQVSSSYGELQQSIGGIETLFGESAQKVIENANNAYTTAGISANEYMQQVTSFSASLLQSLGGDTEKAAEAADMAVRDMADNANKMGTSMEMIQNAYQGFSKQNYTMLDNLKLGYGGTKSEMERLLADAEKISGVKYDISNLNDVYSAIHVIQQELGITGTTALEAGETIEGSFNSLSASWQNFIAGLGNPDADMALIVDNLAKGLSGAINNVIPIINNMVSVLPTVMDAIIGAVNDLAPTFIKTFTSLITQVIDGIVKLLPTIIPLVVDTLESVINALVSNLPQIIDAVILLVTEVIKALSDMIPELIPAVVQAVVDIANSLLENLPTILDAVLQMILGIADGLLKALPILINALPKIIGGIINFLLGAIPQIIEASIQLFMAIVEAIPTIITELISTLPQIITTIIECLVTAIPQIIEASIQLFMGILEAIPTIITELISAIPQIITSTIECLISATPQLIEASIQLFMAIVEAIPLIVERLTTDLPQIVTTIVECLKSLPGMLQGIWSGVLNDLKPFFSNFVSQAKTGASDFINKIKEFISNLPYNIGVWLGTALAKVVTWSTDLAIKAKEAGQNFITNVVNFIKNLPSNIHKFLSETLTKVVEWGKNLPQKGKECAEKLCNAVVNGIKNLPTNIANLGKDIVNGLWNGINNAKDWLNEKISGFASGVVDGFKGALGIHSPSAVMRDEVGKPIGDGVGEGISESMEYVTRTLTDAQKDMLSEAKEQYDRLLKLYKDGQITRSEYESLYNNIVEEHSDVRIEIAEYEAEKISAYNKQVENERKSYLRDRLSDAKETFNELFDLYENEKVTKEQFESQYADIVKKYGDVRVDLEKYTQDKITNYETKKYEERKKATESKIKEFTSNFESKISEIKSKVDSFAGKVTKSFESMFTFTTNKDVYDNELKSYEDELKSLNKSLEESKTKYGENSREVERYEKQIADLNKTIENYKANHDSSKDSEIIGVNTSGKIKQSTKDINEYLNLIEQLKGRGINSAMLKELSGMSQEEGMAVAEYWNSLSDEQLKALANNWQKYNDSVTKLSETLYNDEIDSALTEYKEKVKENLNGLPEDLKEVGVNVVKGLWDGVNQTGGWLQERISSFCNDVIEKFKASFQIASPSRVMAELGGYITQGLGVGISEDDSAEKAIDEKVDNIISTANSLNNIKIGTSIDNVIGENPMQKYQVDFNAQIGSLNDGFDRLIGLVGSYLPNISENMNRPIAVDGNALAVSMGRQIDNQLGKMAISKGRGNV